MIDYQKKKKKTNEKNQSHIDISLHLALTSFNNVVQANYQILIYKSFKTSKLFPLTQLEHIFAFE